MAQCPPDRRAELEDINKQSDYGYISRQEFITEVARLSDQTPAQIATLLEQVHVRNSELIAMIHTLRQRYPAIKIGLLSNVGSDTIERLFAPDELRHLFDAVVLSYAEHVAKPSREAFELAADRLGVPPSQCVMIDDRLDNCSGAEAAGMRAILTQPIAAQWPSLRSWWGSDDDGVAWADGRLFACAACLHTMDGAAAAWQDAQYAY